MKEKKRSTSRKSKHASAQIEKKTKGDIGACGLYDVNEKSYKAPGSCVCYSLRRVFGSKKRYRHHEQTPEDLGYESSSSKSTTHSMPTITTASSNDSPRIISPKLSLEALDDNIGIGSVEKTRILNSDVMSSSTNNTLLDCQLQPIGYENDLFGSDCNRFTNSESSILTTDFSPETEAALSLAELLTKGMRLSNENSEVIGTNNVESTSTRCSECYSLPDDAETALIEHQLDEMSNQSSILSFDADDFLEDDTEYVNYALHDGENCVDLTPIHEEVDEDSE